LKNNKFSLDSIDLNKKTNKDNIGVIKDITEDIIRAMMVKEVKTDKVCILYKSGL